MSSPLDVQRIRELEEALAQTQRVSALHGRVYVGIVGDGLRILVAAAQAGDAGSQTELRNLRNVLREVLDSENDTRSRIAVVRRPEN